MIITGCRSVEKMIDQGDFDTALLKSVRKISGKEQLKEKYVLAIEEAFKKATQRDMDFILTHQQSEKAADWYSTIEHLRKIIKRQNALNPLLPIISKEGRKANFAFVKTKDMLATAIDHFQDLTFQDGNYYLSEARAGDKAAARKAYQIFNRLWEFSDNYQNACDLQNEAEEIGISHIRVSIENSTYSAIPESLLEDLLALGFQDEKWIKYHFANSIEFPDRQVTVVLQSLEIGPERLHEQVRLEEQEIEDGFKYQFDENGNVAKDSLGNDIKIPLYKRVKARFVLTEQIKDGWVSGYIINENLLTGKTEQVPFESQVVFENTFAKFRGDRRALSNNSRQLLNSAPLPFPSDQQMVIDLMQTLKPILRNRIDKLELLV